jgi:hypothetical protein
MHWAVNSKLLSNNGHLLNSEVDYKCILRLVTVFVRHHILVSEVGWNGMDWMDLAQDRDRWRALVNVVNLRVP